MSDIAFDTAGRAAIATLNRPKALNALTEGMVDALAEAMDEWARDERIERVVLRAAEGRAFCAGGDIRDIYERRAGALDFFAKEYRLNHAIATFAKPWVALIDGIVMGGGVGLSIHGSHRVGGPGVRFAMPEVGIGLFPDVGATHALARMPHGAGLWLALTGKTVRRDEARAIGFLTHAVRDDALEAALDRSAHARDLDRALDDLAEDAAPWPAERTGPLERAMAADTMIGVLEQLEAADDEASEEAAKAIRPRSPTSLTIAHRQVREAARKDVAEVLETDFRIVSRILDGHDLYEGIRATVIDKDGAPRWDPATLEAVDAREIDAHFARSAHGDLGLVRPAPPRREASGG